MDQNLWLSSIPVQTASRLNIDESKQQNIKKIKCTKETVQFYQSPS